MLLTFLCTASCVNDYNPFENRDNIDVKVRSSVSSLELRDTFMIFSTESLVVYPTLFEQIDSFIVKSPGNRLWSSSSSTIIKPHAGDYRFYFSWNDTGHSSVTLTVFRSDGEQFSRSYDFQLVSPLFQNGITCEVGAPCSLFTLPPHDQNLIYHWHFGTFFGKPVEYKNFRNGPNTVELTIGQIQGIGSLWISDTFGNRSPSAEFNYNFTDNHGPAIAAISGLLNEDTVVTGDSLFLFRFLVMDKGGVRNITINGGDFDDREQTANGELITKAIPNMQIATSTNPYNVTVTATDNSGTSTTKTFYTWYSSNGPRSEAVLLRIVNPGSATWTTPDSSISLMYNCNNYSWDTVFVRAFRGNSFSSRPDTILPRSEKKLITWECPLSTGSNQVSVFAYRIDTLASDVVVIDRSLNDTLPPKIPYILINGIEGDRHVVQSSDVVCSFLAIGGSGTITDVTVNGSHPSAVLGHSYQYIDTIHTSHTGTSLRFIAIDNNGLRADTSIFVRHNSLPELHGSFSRRYIIGSRQMDTISITDNDQDSIVFAMEVDSVVKSAFSFKRINRNQVVVEWLETQSPPEGLYNATLSLWDGYQTTNIQKQFYVTTTNNTSIQSYLLVRTLPSNADTLLNGTIDLRKNTNPIKIDFNIKDKLKELSKTDSIVVENADAVYFSNDQGTFSVVLADGNGRFEDTVNVLIKNAAGIIDTAGRIPILYPPKSPEYMTGLEYWQGLDRGIGTDITLRDTTTLEWWINRVYSIKQFYSYYEGNEALFDGQLTPGGKPALRFGNRSVVLINYMNEDLGLGGTWPNNPFTVFVFARTQNPLPSTGGALWSSSDHDSIYFALGISGNGKLAVLNRESNESVPTITESNVLLDTSWHILMFRSQGINSQTNEVRIQMGLSELPSDTITAPIDGISSNLMIGGANKHVGRLAWPGYIAELVFFKRSLSDRECREIGAYLRLQHGI
jgi:hypothetical protein